MSERLNQIYLSFKFLFPCISVNIAPNYIDIYRAIDNCDVTQMLFKNIVNKMFIDFVYFLKN